jgi:hypothetical protein
MFRPPQNFLPKQPSDLARHACHAAMTETIVPHHRLHPANNDSPSFNARSLNETITIFGMDGAAEFIAAGFRFQAIEQR